MKRKQIILSLLLSVFLFASASIAQDLPAPTPEEESEDWEAGLAKDLEDLDNKNNKLQDSRGTASPVQMNQNTNRSAQNLMMDISLAVDIVGQWDRQKPQVTPNGLDVRSAEIGFMGAVDQWLRGLLLIAAHEENGAYFFEIHEAAVEFPFLPFNTSLKLGTMFMDVGRLNRIHEHDRPFTMTPIVHEMLLDSESIVDTGGELSILFPWSFLTQELVLGSTNGQKYGHSHTAGIKKNNPLGYAHLKNFYYFGNNWGSQFGFTGLRYEPTEDSENERYMYGMDAVVRWNRSNLREFLVMGELWYNEERFPSNKVTYDPATGTLTPPPSYLPYPGRPGKRIQRGHYLFLMYKFHQLWSAGFRYDFFTDYSLKKQDGYRANNKIEAHTLQVTFRPSEFSYLRATIERRFQRDFSSQTQQTSLAQGLVVTPDFEKVDYRYYIQAMFILGAHPAHTY
ncbi:MAG: hypothetical protein AAF518_27160 [Spirochaetota bacterium]